MDDPIASLHRRQSLDIFADLSALAMFSQDADGRVVRWNRGAERIFGYAEKEIIGDALASLAAPHYRADLDAVGQRVAAGERIDRVFTEIQRKDGMPVPIALSVSPVNDAVRRLRRRRRCGSRAHRDTSCPGGPCRGRRAFPRVEGLAHVGRWLWDVGTDAVQWSDELHRMHGIDPLDFEGTLAAHLTVVHPDDRDRVRSLMEAAVASGEALRGRVPRRRWNDTMVCDSGGAGYWLVR